MTPRRREERKENLFKSGNKSVLNCILGIFLPHLRALCAFAVIEAEPRAYSLVNSPPSARFYLAALRESAPVHDGK